MLAIMCFSAKYFVFTCTELSFPRHIKFQFSYEGKSSFSTANVKDFN